MYGEMQRIVRDEGGAVIPVFSDYVDAANIKLRFGDLSSNWQLDGLRAAERWWFGS
jgi:peptide/nickel transport system substrate-binding protein